MATAERTRILIAGGGYVGLSAALRLERRLTRHEADIFVINPENYMVYQPLLPEVASGTLEPRHAVVPLRRALRRTHLITGRLVELDHIRRTASIAPYESEVYQAHYDHLVLGLGSVTRVLPIPGLEEAAIGFQTIEEAIHLRNWTLSRMELAENSHDERLRRRALTFVFVGGGYTGVEALAELEDMAASIVDTFPGTRREDLRWILVEATDRILRTVPPDLSRVALDILRGRGIDVRLETTLDSAEDGRLRLSDGEELESDTLVWVAGVQPTPAVGRLGLPVDDMGRLPVDRYLRVQDVEGVWAAGDCAAVPDIEQGGHHPPTAQHARREGSQIAENISQALHGETPTEFRYASRGELITLGRRKGVGIVAGRAVTGLPAWLLRRAYYIPQIPTLQRKLRILLDWATEAVFRRDIVGLGSLERPRAPLREAARSKAA